MTKRVNIVTREIKNEDGTIKQKGGVVFRVSQRLADNQATMGYAIYTSKQKLKSLQKRYDKSEKNYNKLLKLGIKLEKSKVLSKDKGNIGDVFFDPTNGKVIVHLEVYNEKLESGEWVTRAYGGLPPRMIIGYRDRIMPISYGN